MITWIWPRKAYHGHDTQLKAIEGREQDSIPCGGPARLNVAVLQIGKKRLITTTPPEAGKLLNF